MTHSFQFKDRGLFCRFYGNLEDEDLILANSELVGFQEFEEIDYIIWDVTGIESYQLDKLSAELSASFAASVNRYNPHVKVAFLANDNYIRELIDYYIELTLIQVPHAQQKLFNSMSDARVWISRSGNQ